MAQSNSDSESGDALFSRRISQDPAWAMKEIRKSRHKTPVDMWIAIVLFEIVPAVHYSLLDDGVLQVLKDIITDPNISVNSVDEQVCDHSSAACRMTIK
jgi:hypothetical protein